MTVAVRSPILLSRTPYGATSRIAKNASAHLNALLDSNDVADEAVLDSGLQPGEIVVVDGLQKVSPGATVKPVFAIPPTAGAADLPGDEAVEVVDIVADYAFVAEHHHDGERAGVEEGVDEQVEGHGL